MKISKLTPFEVLLVIVGFCAVLVCLTFIVMYVYALVHYGNTPVSECPVWVWWILHNPQ